MRTLMKVCMQVEAANRAIRDDVLPKLLDSTMQQLKPEACYFTTENGMRTMYMVFDLDDPSRIPIIAEPFFMTLQAQITLAPVMNAEDVKRGLERAAHA